MRLKLLQRLSPGQGQDATVMLRKGSSFMSKEAQDAERNLRSLSLSSPKLCRSPLKRTDSDIDDFSFSPSADTTSDAFDMDDMFLDESLCESLRRSSEDLSDVSPLASYIPTETPSETEGDESEAQILQDLSEPESEIAVPRNAAEQLRIGILNEGTANAPTPLPVRPSPESLAVLRVIGHGLHGHVRVVQDPATSTLYALKIMPKALVNTKEREEQLLNEYQAMQLLSSPFCVHLHAAFQNRDALFFLMDYVGGGDLFFHLDKYGYFDEAAARFFVACTLLALQHVHSLGFVYRDVKPENLVLDDKGYLRMIDFGFAKRTDSARTYTACGTPDYQAPEVITEAGARAEADFWSVGVLLYELLCGYTPFGSPTGNPMDVFRNILQGQLVLPSKLSPAAADLIRALLQADPAERLGSGPGGIQEIMDHTFFKGFEWEALRRLELKSPIIPKSRKVLTAKYFKPCHEFGVPRCEETAASALWDGWDWGDVKLPHVLTSSSLDGTSSATGQRVVVL